jgi:hypothetical protein
MVCECGSDKIISISGKTADTCNTAFKDISVDGHVPRDIGVGGGDYIEFEYCGDCGVIQDFESLTEDEITQALEA